MFLQVRRVSPLALCISVAAGLCTVLALNEARGQTAEEHASHHPDQAAPAAQTGASPGAKPGGMMEGMAEMMKGMGAPPPKDFYPSLMALPELSPEQRKKIEDEASERMHAGSALMGQALDKLNAGTQSDDYAAMQDAASRLREGITQLESGIAARRALVEGKAPREVALTWFKREMNLSLGTEPAPHGLFGPSVFHLLTMALLVVFALAMLALYFFKMRRAAALFGRLDPDAGSPPPGSSPPLGGGPRPPPSSGGTTPPAEGSPLSQSERPSPAEKATVRTSPSAASSARVLNGNGSAPLTAKWLGRLRVENIKRETPSVQTYRLRSRGGGALPFTFVPGQFLNVAFGIGGARMNRSYSISSSPNERDYVELTIKREERGAVSRHIADLLAVGDEIETGGPVGKFTFDGTESESIVLLSAGVGITPMTCITRYLTERSWPGEIFFIYSCRTPADFMFREAIASLERRNSKLHVVITMTKPTPDWKGPRGRITKEFLTRAVPDLASRRVHLCGPVSMMDATKALLFEIGVSPDNLKTEQFGAVKPPLGAPGTSAKPSSPATGPRVTFSTNNKSARVHENQTILELSEELGIGIEFSCRVGTCGVCKVKMTAGEVDQEVQDALDDDDKKSGVILACQAKPRTEVTVNA